MVPRKVRICLYESAHRSEVAWWIEAESRRHRVENGEFTTVVVAVALQREEYHVVAAVEGHELETPEAEQRPGLERLLEATHLELNGKLFVNTQQAPTWRANCRRFDPGGSLDRRVKLSLRVPAQMGWCETEHKGENAARVILRQGDALAVGVTSVARERERVSLFVSSLSPRDPPAWRPWTFLL
jgi:hypothetical protein